MSAHVHSKYTTVGAVDVSVMCNTRPLEIPHAVGWPENGWLNTGYRPFVGFFTTPPAGYNSFLMVLSRVSTSPSPTFVCLLGHSLLL